MINLIRNDDRLIHGQCMTTLVQYFKIKHIIVVDDITATNPTLRMVIKMIALPGMVNEVFTVADSIEPIKKAVKDDVSTMVVFRFPSIAKQLFDSIDDLPKSLMVGPVQKQTADAVEVNIGSFISKADGEILRYLHDEKGVDVHFQITPAMKRISWTDAAKSLK